MKKSLFLPIILIVLSGCSMWQGYHGTMHGSSGQTSTMSQISSQDSVRIEVETRELFAEEKGSVLARVLNAETGEPMVIDSIEAVVKGPAISGEEAISADTVEVDKEKPPIHKLEMSFDEAGQYLMTLNVRLPDGTMISTKPYTLSVGEARSWSQRNAKPLAVAGGVAMGLMMILLHAF